MPACQEKRSTCAVMVEAGKSEVAPGLCLWRILYKMGHTIFNSNITKGLMNRYKIHETPGIGSLLGFNCLVECGLSLGFGFDSQSRYMMEACSMLRLIA